MQITEENLARMNGLIQWNADGLVPAVIQDAASREVLMLAYMNRESLQRTLAEGRSCFYSRSRRELWLKGETSGHFQDVVDIRLDCDGDCLLVNVRQRGVACHTGSFSCFYRRLAPLEGQEGPGTTVDTRTEIPLSEQTEAVRTTLQFESEQGPLERDLGKVLSELAGIIALRKSQRPEGAYTTYLFDKGLDKILKKVGEETAEVIIAAKNQAPKEIIYEVSDLFYHILVLLTECGVSMSDIGEELQSRRK